MNKVWYLRRGPDVFGPAETQRVVEMVKSGRLSATDEASTSWEGPFAPISSIVELAPIRPLSELDRELVPSSASPASAVEAAAPHEPSPLPEEVRKKYVKALSKNGKIWVGTVAFFVSLLAVALLGQLVGVKAGWAAFVEVVLAIIVAGVCADMYESARANALAKHSEKMLEVMYEEQERASMVSSIVTGLGTLALAAGALWWLFDTPGGERFRLTATSDASCSLGAVFHRPQVFNIDGRPHAGYVIYTTIENKGKKGRVLVEASLTTTEGTVTHRQWEAFEPGEQREVKVNFPEPSVDAKNPASLLSCEPRQ